tara:strand:- start:434 stop:1198 length:765 start_codon:yes stop_codon:yes gene_type:complete
MKQQIINPETGRLVNRTGTIGRRLTRMKEVHTDQSRYKWVINQWDWWSTQTNKVRQEVVRSGWWDTSLNDISGNKGKYPLYVMRYEKVLKKAKKIVDKISIAKVAKLIKVKDTKTSISIKKNKTAKINNNWLRKLTASQKNTYKTLTTKTKKELEKVGIKVLVYPLNLTDSGYYISDFALEYANKLVNDTDSYIIIILKIDNDIIDLQKDKSLHIQHSNITYKNKTNLIQIFKKTLGNKYKWNGKQTKTIDVKL